MSTYSSPTDVVAGSLARASSLNAVDAAVATAFALLPNETRLSRGTVNFAIDTGAANAFVVTLAQVPSGYVDGLLIVMLPITTNTGACTVNVNSLGVKSIKMPDSTDPISGEIRTGVPVEMRYSTVTGYCHLLKSTISFTSAADVAHGGTGLTTLTAGGIICGNGTSSVQIVSPGLTTQILVGGGASAVPVWGTDIPTAVTIGSAYVYRVGGTDVSVADGGTGRSTGTTAYALIATGTTATGAQQTLAAGATTEILVGGGASALPVWTACTGSGAPVRANSPSLVTPVLGTPQSGTLTYCTGLPVGGGGTGGSSASITLFNNITGLSAAGTTGTTSTNLVFSTSPSLTTPSLGAATATSINKVAISAVATAATLTLTDNTTITFPGETAAVGYMNIPQNSQSGDYTCVLLDQGKHILHPAADTTARAFTIPANASVAYAVGTALTFVNQNAAGTITIAITSDTMRLAGFGTTGSRTLAANGVATAIKVTSTEWIISGVGLT
jgi:hypothetical protein